MQRARPGNSTSLPPKTGVLEPLAVTDGEKSAEYKRRRDAFLYEKVPIGGEQPYLSDGWATDRTLQRSYRLKRAKSSDRQFEDDVWCLFYKMGFDELNKGHNFTITYKEDNGIKLQKQVDVLAKDSETIIIGECKCCDDYKPRSLGKDITEFVGLQKKYADAIRIQYGKDYKPKILWFFFTSKIIWSDTDRAKAKDANIKVMTEREVDYFRQLADHIGRASRYQFLAEYLGGQKIPELKDTKVPAVRVT
jgi:hypothetical protein